MSRFVAELLSELASAGGDPLVGAASLQRIREVELLLPRSTGGVSLECHLGRAAPRSDLVVRVFGRDRQDLFRDGGPRLEPARRFAEAWAAPAPGMENVPYIDLEFDLDGSGRSCFVGAMIEPGLHHGMAVVPADRDSPTWMRSSSSYHVASAVLRASEPSPVGQDTLRAVERAFDALPRGGFVGHVGSLRCRQDDGEDLVRLIVSLPRRAVRAYLTAISWPGDLDALDSALELYLGARARRVDVDLNVNTSGLLPDTGFYRPVWTPYDDDVAGIASGLIGSGLATEQQANALTCFAARTGAPVGGIPWTMTFKTKLDRAGRAAAKAYLSLLRIA